MTLHSWRPRFLSLRLRVKQIWNIGNWEIFAIAFDVCVVHQHLCLLRLTRNVYAKTVGCDN